MSGTPFGITHSYKKASFTRTRTNKGKAKFTYTDATFDGTIQPAVGKDLEIVPDGRRDKGNVKVYSSTELKVGKEGTKYSGDIVFYQNMKWEITIALPYQNNVISHYKYIAEMRGKQ